MSADTPQETPLLNALNLARLAAILDPKSCLRGDSSAALDAALDLYQAAHERLVSSFADEIEEFQRRNSVPRLLHTPEAAHDAVLDFLDERGFELKKTSTLLTHLEAYVLDKAAIEQKPAEQGPREWKGFLRDAKHDVEGEAAYNFRIEDLEEFCRWHIEIDRLKARGRKPNAKKKGGPPADVIVITLLNALWPPSMADLERSQMVEKITSEPSWLESSKKILRELRSWKARNS